MTNIFLSLHKIINNIFLHLNIDIYNRSQIEIFLYILRNRHNYVAVSSFLIILIQIFIVLSVGAEAENEDSDFVELYKFSSVYSVYQDGSEQYVRVTVGNEEFLWDPLKLKLTKWQDSFQEFLKREDSLVGLRPVQLPDGDQLIHHFDRSAFATTSFTDYFSLVRQEKSIEQFYIVQMADQNGVQSRWCCDNPTPAETIKVSYEPTAAVAVAGISRSSLLVITFGHQTVYVFKMHRLPAHGINADRMMFIIPYKPLSDELDKAGVGLVERYQIIKSAVTNSIAAKPVTPGPIVDPEQFFSSEGKPQ